jgi:Pseudopilin GspJ.
MAMTYIRGLVSPNSAGSIPYFFIGKLEERQHSSISFTSFSHERGVDSKSPDQVEISYYLEPVPETDLFFLIKREDPNITLEDSEFEENNSSGIQYVMSERVVEFKLEYMTQIEDEFTDDFAEEEWDSTQTNSLPKIVEVTLIMRSPRGEDVLFNSLILIPLAN